MVAAIDSKSVPVRGGSSSLPLGTRTELNGFFKARRWDARSASHWFPPIFPNEFGFPPSAGRRVFSPRNRCEPKISLAQTFLTKRSVSEAILSSGRASFRPFSGGKDFALPRFFCFLGGASAAQVREECAAVSSCGRGMDKIKN